VKLSVSEYGIIFVADVNTSQSVSNKYFVFSTGQKNGFTASKTISLNVQIKQVI